MVVDINMTNWEKTVMTEILRKKKKMEMKEYEINVKVCVCVLAKNEAEAQELAGNWVGVVELPNDKDSERVNFVYAEVEQ